MKALALQNEAFFQAHPVPGLERSIAQVVESRSDQNIQTLGIFGACELWSHWGEIMKSPEIPLLGRNFVSPFGFDLASTSALRIFEE